MSRPSNTFSPLPIFISYFRLTNCGNDQRTLRLPPALKTQSLTTNGAGTRAECAAQFHFPIIAERPDLCVRTRKIHTRRLTDPEPLDGAVKQKPYIIRRASAPFNFVFFPLTINKKWIWRVSTLFCVVSDFEVGKRSVLSSV
jgi:hypothetical protein